MSDRIRSITPCRRCGKVEKWIETGALAFPSLRRGFILLSPRTGEY